MLSVNQFALTQPAHLLRWMGTPKMPLGRLATAFSGRAVLKIEVHGSYETVLEPERLIHIETYAEITPQNAAAIHSKT